MSTLGGNRFPMGLRAPFSGSPRGALRGCTLTQDGVLHPAGQFWPALGRKGGLGTAQLHSLKLEGTGAFLRGRNILSRVTQLAPRCCAQRLPSASPGDSSVFMFHPGLPAAEPPPGQAGGQAAQGFRDQVLLRCASSLPGRCDSCSLGSYSCVAGVLGLACGIWEAQLPGGPSLDYPLC